MKKIIVLSDTHGFCDEAILAHCSWADEIWHAGDWGPEVDKKLLKTGKILSGVYGNIDDQRIRVMFPEIISFTCEGVKVFMKHIAGHPGRYSQGIKPLLLQEKPDLFICGHSHILKIARDKAIRNLLFVNPGAAGIHGFHIRRTMVRFLLDKGEIKNMEVVDLGPRSAIQSNRSEENS